MPIDHSQRQRLLRGLTRKTSDPDMAEDCLQSALLRLEEFRLRSVVRNEMRFLAYAATNIVIDEVRRKRTQEEFRNSLGFLVDVDPYPLQEDVLFERERLEHIRFALDHLPERTRRAFLMHRIENMKYREIADRTGMSMSAVEKHIAKAALAITIVSEDYNCLG